MSKPTKKRNKFNPIVIERLRTKYGLTTQYIRMSLRGDRKSETSEKIVKDYKLYDDEVKKALNN